MGLGQSGTLCTTHVSSFLCHLKQHITCVCAGEQGNLQLVHFCIHIDVTFLPASRGKDQQQQQHLLWLRFICLMVKLNCFLQLHLGQSPSTAVPPSLNNGPSELIDLYIYLMLSLPSSDSCLDQKAGINIQIFVIMGYFNVKMICLVPLHAYIHGVITSVSD